MMEYKQFVASVIVPINDRQHQEDLMHIEIEQKAKEEYRRVEEALNDAFERYRKDWRTQKQSNTEKLTQALNAERLRHHHVRATLDLERQRAYADRKAELIREATENNTGSSERSYIDGMLSAGMPADIAEKLEAKEGGRL